MRVVYIADDGKEFDNEFECEHYEWLQEHTNLKDIKCYDENGILYEDILSNETYEFCQKIIVPTNECAKELKDLAEYTGFCYYSHVTEKGIWKFEEYGTQRGFVKVEDYYG